jgi:hypothetical protein
MNEGHGISMAQLPSWTGEVSERLMDLQIAVERGDGRRRLISLIHETQEFVKDTESQIVGYCTTLRTGTPPKRLRLVVSNQDEAPPSAA